MGAHGQTGRRPLGLGIAHLPDPRGIPGALALRRGPHLCQHRRPEIKGKADYIVSEVARCQEENGGEWAGPIPEKYLDWLARGKTVWAPHCTVHRNMMGLYDMYAWAGNQQALEILVKWARWFSRWTAQFTREQFDDILDVETGGMLESWADLYGVTGEKEHYELIQRYDRRRLFDPLLAGKDVLTNMHANTTIPEIQGRRAPGR